MVTFRYSLILIISIILTSCGDDVEFNSNYYPAAKIFNDSIALAASSDGVILKSLDDFSQWQEVSKHNGVDFFDFFQLNDSIFFATAIDGEVFISMDHGDSWTEIPLDIGKKPRVFSSANNVYIASSNSRLFISNELLFNWRRLDTPPGLRIKGVYEDDRNYLWIATSNPNTSTDTLFFNRDFGQYWFPGLVVEDEIQFVYGSGTQLVLGSSNSIQYSSNRGESWNQSWKLEKIIQDSVSQFSSSNIYLESSHSSGNTIIAGGLFNGSKPSMLVTRNFGKNWFDLNYEDEWIDFGSGVNSINLNSTIDYNISGDGGVILKTTNGGSSWEAIRISI